MKGWSLSIDMASGSCPVSLKNTILWGSAFKDQGSPGAFCLGCHPQPALQALQRALRHGGKMLYLDLSFAQLDPELHRYNRPHTFSG